MEGRPPRERRRVGALLNARLGVGGGLAQRVHRGTFTKESIPETTTVCMGFVRHLYTLDYAGVEVLVSSTFLSSAGRYYHIEGTEKKDPAVAAPGGSDLDKVGFDAKRSLDMLDGPHLSFGFLF